LTSSDALAELILEHLAARFRGSRGGGSIRCRRTLSSAISLLDAATGKVMKHELEREEAST